MKIILTILQKTIVNHFYKVNTGFFLFIFFVFFGLPYNAAAFHLSIIHSIIQSPVILLIVLGLWLLYNFKCMDYTIKQLHEPQQNFLYCLHAMSMKNLVVYFLYVQAMMYMPVLLYAIAIVTIAWNAGQFYIIATIIFFNAAILFSTAYLYALVLQRRAFAKRIILFPSFHFRLRKHFFSVPLFFLVSNRKQMLLVTKFFSLLLLFIFMKVYEPEHYDLRPLLHCFMLAVTSNCAVVFQLKNFEDDFLQSFKNFSFTIAKRFFYIVTMYILLLLPEFIFIWKAYPAFFSAEDFFQLFLFGISLLCLFHASLYTHDMNMDSFMKIVFLILSILFFLIFYNPGILLPFSMLLLSFALYHSYYLDFEKKP